MDHKHKQKGSKSSEMIMHHYGRLLLMVGLSFVSMFILMYAMVDAFENVFVSVNQFYMAGLMTAPMVIIEMALMGGMYPQKKLNVAIIAVSAIALAGFWMLIRTQAAVSDKQFLRSMIPHHAGAILMCDESSITDPEIRALCESIKSGQQSEIAQMKRKLEDLEAK